MINGELDDKNDSLKIKLRHWITVLDNLEKYRESGHVFIDGKTDKEHEEDEKTINLIHYNISTKLNKVRDKIHEYLKA